MSTLGEHYAAELNMEEKATRACLERIPGELFEYKPHEKSMKMGYLASVTADIPRWISIMIEQGVIDFGTWEKREPKNGPEFLALFDENMKHAREVLRNTPDEKMSEMFYLKHNGVDLMSDTIGRSIVSAINHLVHHRGQLTVYMRLNNIPVPSIYGPSADDKNF